MVFPNFKLMINLKKRKPFHACDQAGDRQGKKCLFNKSRSIWKGEYYLFFSGKSEFLHVHGCHQLS